MVIFNEPVKFISGQSLWVMPCYFNKRFIWFKYWYKSEADKVVWQIWLLYKWTCSITP
jgi:hypothetical protein